MPVATMLATDGSVRRSAQLSEEIRAYITEQGLGPGDELPSENYFCEMHQASRTVVREAFQQLAALQLIDIGNGRRARVARVNSQGTSMLLEHGLRTTQFSVLQIYDVRRTIEVRMVWLAATLRSPAQARQMLDAAAKMARAWRKGDAAAVMEHDIQLHKLLAAASQNPVFELLQQAFEGIIREAWPKGWKSRRSDEERARNVQLHAEIAQAVHDADAAHAAELMAKHFDDSARALVLAGLR